MGDARRDAELWLRYAREFGSLPRWRGVGGLGLLALLAVVAWLGVLLVVVRGAVSGGILRLRSRMGHVWWGRASRRSLRSG
jgi:hypothetical protein